MVKYRPVYRGGGRRQLRRVMTADDLGMDLLSSPYDPVLLAVGIKAPKAKRSHQLGPNLRQMLGKRIARLRGPQTLAMLINEQRRNDIYTRPMRGHTVRG